MTNTLANNFVEIALMARSCPHCFKIFKDASNPNNTNSEKSTERMLNCLTCSGAFATSLIKGYHQNKSAASFQNDYQDLMKSIGLPGPGHSYHGFRRRAMNSAYRQKRKLRSRSRSRNRRKRR